MEYIVCSAAGGRISLIHRCTYNSACSCIFNFILLFVYIHTSQPHLQWWRCNGNIIGTIDFKRIVHLPLEFPSHWATAISNTYTLYIWIEFFRHFYFYFFSFYFFSEIRNENTNHNPNSSNFFHIYYTFNWVYNFSEFAFRYCRFYWSYCNFGNKKLLRKCFSYRVCYNWTEHVLSNVRHHLTNFIDLFAFNACIAFLCDLVLINSSFFLFSC